MITVSLCSAAPIAYNHSKLACRCRADDPPVSCDNYYSGLYKELAYIAHGI